MPEIEFSMSIHPVWGSEEAQSLPQEAHGARPGNTQDGMAVHKRAETCNGQFKKASPPNCMLFKIGRPEEKPHTPGRTYIPYRVCFTVIFWKKVLKRKDTRWAEFNLPACVLGVHSFYHRFQAGHLVSWRCWTSRTRGGVWWYETSRRGQEV